MHKQNFATQPTDWPTTSKETWRLDENLHATGRPSTAQNGQNKPLHLGSSSANADDPPIWEAGVSSNHSEMASGCWDIGLGLQPDVLGSLWSTGDAAVSGGRRHRVWDRRQWRPCIFSDESRFSLYHSDGRVRVCRRQRARLIDACVQPNDGNRGPSVMVWGVIHHGGSELVVAKLTVRAMIW